ncbi:MAG: 3-deoxy-D-manno-octulosonic acid transferase [Candidatus Omnitrophica bacterium]|nr:3-deoxy-D-manno-octulosonic acid transferase [Candidatus Omnitrophota bacterium]
MALLYDALVILGLLCAAPAALWRRRLPHRGWSMRLGRYPAALLRRLNGRPSIWLHAVSVGEVLAAHPLIEALLRVHVDTPLVVSTVTPGGYEVAAKRWSERAILVYFPLDLHGCVRRALKALRPKMLLLVESELWPAVVRLARAQGVPVLVVNGRVSPRTFERCRRIARWVRPLLRQVDQWLMQSREDADRIIALGAPPDRVQVTGSLKWDASRGVRPTAQALRELAVQLGLGGEPLLVAGSTHRGEEAVLLGALKTVRAAHPSARLILAPRHLERVAEVEGLIRRSGLTVTRLSSASSADRWDVGVVETFGQLPQYYSVATVVFIGGSLIPHGGQNPLEAASLGKPVVFGPSLHNFSAIAHQLLAHHAARQVAHAGELSGLLRELLADPASAAAMGQRAQELTERFQGATQRTVDAVAPWLQGGRAWPAGYG